MAEKRPIEAVILPKHQKLQARAETLLARMRQGKRVLKPMTWPGRPEVRFQFSVLSSSEVQECFFAAFKVFAEAGVDPGHVVLMGPFDDELACQILYRAMLDPDRALDENGQPRRLARDIQDLRDNSEEHERDYLLDQYADFRKSVDPTPDDLSQEENDAIVEAVKKKDRVVLKGFGSAKLASFLLTSASPPSTSPTDRSGSGGD